MSDESAMFIIGFFLSLLLSFYLFYSIYNDGLNQCAKQHNVYACEYVAVPKKEGE